MAKVKTTFFCQNCGAQYAKWQGQCNACKSWNTIVEEVFQVPQKIRDISVCEVVTDELYDEGRPKTGGLRDPKFGVSSRRGICTACQRTWTQCSGHFGHYELPFPMYHIGWIPEVLFWLRKTCVHCGHLSAKKLGKKCPKCKI